MAFVEAVRKFYDGILIVAGGITRGYQLRTLELMGADLAYCGTRFIVTPQSGAPVDHKSAIIDAEINDVWDGGPMRGNHDSAPRTSVDRARPNPHTRLLQAMPRKSTKEPE